MILLSLVGAVFALPLFPPTFQNHMTHDLRSQIHCNFCGALIDQTENRANIVFVQNKDKDGNVFCGHVITVCDNCLDDDFGDWIKLCPHCRALVHIDLISNTGTCPSCFFHEDETGNEGSSWI